MESGGTQPTLQTLEKLASAVGAELVVGAGENLSANRSIAKLVRDGHAVIRHELAFHVRSLHPVLRSVWSIAA